MAEMTAEEVDSFLLEPRHGVLSVRLGSGRSIGTPVWFLWVDGVARFQSPTTSAKTKAIRATGRASLCVHAQDGALARYVTLEGPVREVKFDFEADFVPAAKHYAGAGATTFLRRVQAALDSGHKWASFELVPEFTSAKTQTLY